VICSKGKNNTPAFPDETIISKIYLVRDKKIMLDSNLAELYGVTTGNLNKAVKRNLNRFHDDFMIQLTEEEFKILIFQNGISKWGGTRKMPFAFTEQGVAMLSFLSSRQRLIHSKLLKISFFKIFVR
jgi:hypothetical protein